MRGLMRVEGPLTCVLASVMLPYSRDVEGFVYYVLDRCDPSRDQAAAGLLETT